MSKSDGKIMTSYLHNPGKTPLKALTIGQLVEEAAALWGNSPCLHDLTSGTLLTFAQLQSESDRFARGLLSLGLRPGDRIGIWSPNSSRWVITFLAAAKAGLISVCLSPDLEPPELVARSQKLGLKCLVFAGRFRNENHFLKLTQAFPHILEKDRDGPSVQIPRWAIKLDHEKENEEGEELEGQVLTYSKVVTMGSTIDSLHRLKLVSSTVHCDDVATILFTSGSTGEPKGVMTSHHSLINITFVFNQPLGFSPQDRICETLPLFHGFGLYFGIFIPLLLGSRAVFPSPKFSPSASIKAVAEQGLTVICGTPTMHIDMLNHPDFFTYNLNSLRLAFTGGAPVPKTLVQEMKEQFTVDKVINVYGITETFTVIRSLLQDSDEVLSTTLGYPVEHCEVKVVDRQGRTVGLGEPGELCIRNFSVMLGYWDEPEETRRVIDQARWFHTGDACVLDDRGYVKMVGRFKDMLIRGGENIFPKEIEDFLHTHPHIVEAHVFGVPDVRLGEAVAAWILLKPGAMMTVQEIQEFCKGQISRCKIPQYIHIMKSAAELPKTGSGKIRKFILRRDYSKSLGLGQDSGA